MEYFKIGDTVDYTKYNGLVYLLRKFKRLRSNIKLGEKNIYNEYGTYRFIGDFTNVNGNYILEGPVNIYSDDVFKNANYEFVFNVINIDTSEEVNRRVIYKQGDTGDEGILNITLPEDMINENEVILPDVTIDVTFNTHEYQNNLSSFNVSLTVQEKFPWLVTNKITLIIKDKDNIPVSNMTTTIYINNIPHQVTTDSNGKAEYNYHCTGTAGKVIVRSNGATAVFFDGGITFGWNEFDVEPDDTHDWETEWGYYAWSVKFGYNSQYNNGESWLPSDGEVELSCELSGDMWTLNNPKTTETFTSIYNSSEPLTEVVYKISGDVIAIGPDMFDSAYGLTWIDIPRGIERIDKRAFYYATNLKTITIPDTVYTLGALCFYNTGIEEIQLPRSINYIGSSVFDKCKIKKYKLSWIGNEIIPYTANRFPIIDETIFEIPYGETANYIAKNYPSDRLEERIMPDTITLTGTPIIETGDTDIITATLFDGSTPVSGETLSYQVKHGSTVLDSGSGTTDSNGQISISYTGTGIGDIDVIVKLDGSSLQETFLIQDCIIYDPLTSNSGKWTIPSSCTTSYDNNGGKFGTATSYSQIKLTDKLTSPVSVEFTVVDYYTSDPTRDYPLIIYQYTNGDTTPNQAILNGSQTKLLAFGNVVSGHTLLKNGVYRIEYGSSTIKIYENDVLIGTGSNNIGLPTRFEFHIGATSGRWLKLKDVKVKHEPSISLTGTSIIESGDTDTITATLLCGSTPVSGETLSYQIKHGSTVLDSGTGTTNANGEIEIIYTGTGVGDIDVIVSYGSDIQETFVVEDCIVYRETLSTNITDLTLPPEYKVEFDIPSTSNGTYAIIGTDNTHRIITGQFSNDNPSLNGVWVYNGSSTPTQNNCPTTPTQNAHYTFTYENNSYTMSNGRSSITGTIPAVINMNNLLSTTYTPSAVRNYKIKAI